MSILKHLSLYFSLCPLTENLRFQVDFLPEEQREIELTCAADPEVLQKYLDGSQLCKFLFYLGCRENGTDELPQPFLDTGFFNRLQDWLSMQKKLRVLPDLGENQQALKLEISSPGFLQAKGTEGREGYHIPFTLTYIQKGEKKSC